MIDLDDFSHCTHCLLEWKVPEPRNGVCTECQRPVQDGQLGLGTPEDPLLYTWKQHRDSVQSLYEWLIDVVVPRRKVALNRIEVQSARGQTIVCLASPSQPFDLFPVRIILQPGTRAIPAPESHSGAASSSTGAMVQSQRPGVVHRVLQAQLSGPVVVHILRVNRHPSSYNQAFGANLENMTLRLVRENLENAGTLQLVCQDLSDAGIEVPEFLTGGEGPLLFARPEVARVALGHLCRSSVQLGSRQFFLGDLKIFHIIVEEDFVNAVKAVLRQLPGGENVKVSANAEIGVTVGTAAGLAAASQEHCDDISAVVQNEDVGQGISFLDVVDIVVQRTFINCVLPPSSLYSRSNGPKTQSESSHLWQPRLKRMRYGGPEAPSASPEAPSSLPSSMSQTLSSTATGSQSQSQSMSLPGIDKMTLNPEEA